MGIKLTPFLLAYRMATRNDANANRTRLLPSLMVMAALAIAWPGDTATALINDRLEQGPDHGDHRDLGPRTDRDLRTGGL